MRIRDVAGGFAVGLALAIGAGWVTARGASGVRGGQEPPPGMSPEALAMVQAMKSAHDNPGEPGAFHRKLERFIGEWDVTVRVWMMGPDLPPLESPGASKIDWVLGGRFTMETITADLNMGGMAVQMESMLVSGYDNYRNIYVGTLMGNTSTEIIPYQGGVSLDGRTFNHYGTMHEPMLNVSGRMIRFETVIEDDDHHTTAVYDLHAGEDYKVLEFAYARKR